MTKNQEGLSKGERTLLIAAGIFAALLLAVAYWHYTLEVNPTITLPVAMPVLPHPNALEYYTRAESMLGALQLTIDGQHYNYTLDELAAFCRGDVDEHAWVKFPNATGRPAPTWAMGEAFVRAQAPAFAVLHQGFAYDYYAAKSRFYKLERALELAGRVDAHHGDWAGATERYLDGMQLSEEYQHGGYFITCLSGRIRQDYGRSGAWEIIPHLTAAQARAAARRMETIIARTQPLPVIWQQEKIESLRWLNECFHKPGWRSEVFGLASMHLSYTDTVRYAAFSKREVAQRFIRAMDLVIADANQPFTAQLRHYDWRDPIYHIRGLNMVGSRCKFDVCDTENILLLLSYALQAYHAEHGRYPDKLSELTPAYVHTIPNDPFAVNKPCCYKRTGSRYVLYSIGPDGIDNGGQASHDGQVNSGQAKKRAVHHGQQHGRYRGGSECAIAQVGH